MKRYKYFFISILIIAILKSFFFELCMVSSGSMNDTLLKGDYLLIIKPKYDFSTPEFIPFTDIRIPSYSLFKVSEVNKNDIIIFNDPREASQTGSRNYIIKRCIAQSGDTITFADKIIINSLARNELSGVRTMDYTQYNIPPIYVPDIGDTLILNRNNIDWKKSLIQRENNWKLKDDEFSNNYVVTEKQYFVLGDNRDASYDSRIFGFLPREYIKGKAILILGSWDPDIKISNIIDKVRSIRWSRTFSILN